MKSQKVKKKRKEKLPKLYVLLFRLNTRVLEMAQHHYAYFAKQFGRSAKPTTFKSSYKNGKRFF